MTGQVQRIQKVSLELQGGVVGYKVMVSVSVGGCGYKEAATRAQQVVDNV